MISVCKMFTFNVSLVGVASNLITINGSGKFDSLWTDERSLLVNSKIDRINPKLPKKGSHFSPDKVFSD